MLSSADVDKTEDKTDNAGVVERATEDCVCGAVDAGTVDCSAVDAGIVACGTVDVAADKDDVDSEEPGATEVDVTLGD